MISRGSLEGKVVGGVVETLVVGGVVEALTPIDVDTYGSPRSIITGGYYSVGVSRPTFGFFC